jgi:hypothetical protein
MLDSLRAYSTPTRNSGSELCLLGVGYEAIKNRGETIRAIRMKQKR